MTTPDMPLTGNDCFRLTDLSFTLEMDVCTVGGKKPANRGRDMKIISAI